MSHLEYRKDIDGLRAVAVLAVLIFHLNSSWLPGGFVGVDIFFVISGYLITKIIMREIDSESFSFVRFYARRVRRIFPALFVMLIGATAMAYLALPNLEYKSFFVDLKYAAGQISNFRFLRTVEYMDVGVETSPLLHTWSLAVEEQFYLIWPLLLTGLCVFVGRKYVKFTLYAVFLLSLLLCIWFVEVGQTKLAFYMFFSRAFELVIGAVVAIYAVDNKKCPRLLKGVIAIAGAVLIGVSILFITKESVFPGYLSLLPTLGAALIIYSGEGSGQNNKTWVYHALSLKPIVCVGLISYSLYLWHWPLISIIQSFTAEPLTNQSSVVVAVLSFILAYASYRFVETPFRKMQYTKSTWGYLRTILKGFFCIVLAIFVAQFFKVNEEKLGRDFEVLPFYQNYFSEINSRHFVCDNQPLDKLKDACVIKGNSTDMIDAVLIGDSHASHYSPSLELWAKEEQKNVAVVFKVGCLLFVASDYSYVKRGDDSTGCPEYARKVKEFLENIHPELVIYAHRNSRILDEDKADSDIRIAGTNDSYQSYKTLWEHEVSSYKESGTKLAFLNQVPTYNTDFRKCYLKNVVTPMGRLLNLSWESCLDGVSALSVSRMPDFVAFLDAIREQNFETFDYFEPDLPGVIDQRTGAVLYYDFNHINHHGATYLQPQLYDFLKKFESF